MSPGGSPGTDGSPTTSPTTGRVFKLAAPKSRFPVGLLRMGGGAKVPSVSAKAVVKPLVQESGSAAAGKVESPRGNAVGKIAHPGEIAQPGKIAHPGEIAHPSEIAHGQPGKNAQPGTSGLPPQPQGDTEEGVDVPAASEFPLTKQFAKQFVRVRPLLSPGDDEDDEPPLRETFRNSLLPVCGTGI